MSRQRDERGIEAWGLHTFGASMRASRRFVMKGFRRQGKLKRLRLTLAVSLLALVGTAAASSPVGELHVTSPDWRDQIIYFLMIDRFNDGDPGNNDQGKGEFDPADRRRFSGGDIQGITAKLDYIQGLGATAVWITPPVANQWWDGRSQYGGYHGYWAEHFAEVDRHFGDLADYQALSRALHGRGMYLIQDIVLNHTGNFFDFDGDWIAARPGHNYVRNRDSVPVTAPRQWPFSLNNPRRAKDREAAVYHWTPAIRDFQQPQQELTFQLANLDDINSASPLARTALRQSYAHWINQVGVDAFRLDTAFYVPPEMLVDFMHADAPDAPGVMHVARATGRDDFFVFGEGFGIDLPYADTQSRKIERYATDAAGQPLLQGMINFPLYGSLNEVFARGRPTAELGDRIRRMMQLHRDPHRMPTFVDNHDVDRFLAGGSEAGLRQALLLILTLPGIPTIYYGTEQGYTQPRKAMFAAGYAAEGRDHFDVDAPLYRYMARAIALRRAHPTLARGRPEVLRAATSGPGVLAYTMTGDEGEALLVIFNSSESPVLLDTLIPASGQAKKLRGLFAIDGAAEDRLTDAAGALSLALPARSGQVWRLESVDGAPAVVAPPELSIAVADGQLQARGVAIGASEIALVLDGQIDQQLRVPVDAEGRFAAQVDTGSLIDPEVEHRLVAWNADLNVASAPAIFRTEPRWTLVAEVSDPAGDDHGPRGRYRYPTDPSWGDNRQLDLRGARAFTAGSSLRLELDMRQVTRSWNPANDFDHVAFSVFISLPGRDDGASELPLQNATMPKGLRWHYRLRAHGWSNAMFSAVGASATADGAPTVPGAQIRVDRDAQRVSFLLPASALGNPASLAGAQVYVTTWDYDAGYRGLNKTASSHSFGGGDGSRDALVMDDLLLPLVQTPR